VSDVSEDAVADEIEVQLGGGSVQGGARAVYVTAHFKKGRRKWRSGRFVRIYDPESGEIKSEVLKLGTWVVSLNAPNLVTLDPDWMWQVEGSEIELLKQFLSENLAEGSYKLVRSDGSGFSQLLAAAMDGEVDAEAASELILQLSQVPGLAEELAGTDVASALVQSVELQRRRDGLARLTAAVDEGQNEERLRPLMKGEAWIFGGQFIGEAARRQLTVHSTVDIPLLRGDGSLHVVELKGPRIPRLVEDYRAAGHVVGQDINRAVGQVQNYLRDLDESAATIKQNLGIDCRRSTGTVVIGNSRVVPEVERSKVAEALRVYNSHLSRIQVMTYDELIDNARRALEFRPAD
jgi:hypothetical protein